MSAESVRFLNFEGTRMSDAGLIWICLCFTLACVVCLKLEPTI